MTATRCAHCGVTIEAETFGGATFSWCDPDRVDVDQPARECESGDHAGEPHEPVVHLAVSAIRFAGITPEGAKGGATAGVDDIAWFVETRFNYGWATLEVHRVSDGVLVGQIHEVDGRRVWWGEAKS